jgi:hypothetical protein
VTEVLGIFHYFIEKFLNYSLRKDLPWALKNILKIQFNWSRRFPEIPLATLLGIYFYLYLLSYIKGGTQAKGI